MLQSAPLGPQLWANRRIAADRDKSTEMREHCNPLKKPRMCALRKTAVATQLTHFKNNELRLETTSTVMAGRYVLASRQSGAEKGD
jgi:hypothetical protein